MPHMVEWYRKNLLAFGMEMGRLPKARSSAPRTAPKRPRVEYDHLYDEEDSDDARYNSLVPQRYLRSLQPMAGTSSLEANTSRSGTKRAPQVRPPGTPMAASYRHDHELGSPTVRCASNLARPAYKQYTGQKCTGCGLPPPWPGLAT